MTGAEPGRAPTPFLRDEAIIAARLLAMGLATAAVIWMGLQVQFIAAAVLIGFAQVALLWPIVRWLRDHKVPQVLAALMSVAAFISVFALLLTFVLSELVDSIPSIVNAITGAVDDVVRWFEQSQLGMEQAGLQDALGELQSMVGTVLGGVSSAAVTGLGVLGNLATVGLVATFFAIFALSSGDRLWQNFRSALPGNKQSPAHAAFRAIMRTVGNWFYASTVTGLVDGVLIGLGLVVLDVPFAVPIAALTFLGAYVPLIGATLAGAVAVAVALFSGGLGTAVWTLVIVLVVQQVEGNVLSPLLMAKALSFHPLVILLLTTTAATAFGLVGLFLAVPLTGAVVSGVMAWKGVVLDRELPNPFSGARARPARAPRAGPSR